MEITSITKRATNRWAFPRHRQVAETKDRSEAELKKNYGAAQQSHASPHRRHRKAFGDASRLQGVARGGQGPMVYMKS